MQSMEPEPIQQKVYLPKWGVWITLLLCSDGAYVVIREMCGVIGVKKVQEQINRLRERDVTAPYVKPKPVETRGGRQDMVCLHQKALGYWLGFINPALARTEARPRLIELQQEILEVAYHALFGIVDGELASAESKIIRLQDRLGNLPTSEDDINNAEE